MILFGMPALHAGVQVFNEHCAVTVRGQSFKAHADVSLLIRSAPGSNAVVRMTATYIR